MDESEKLESVEIRLKWPLEDALAAQYSNQFGIFSVGPEVVLVFGEFLPTALLPGRRKEEMGKFLGEAAIKPIAKFVISKEGIKLLHGLLEDFLSKQDLSNEVKHD